MLRLLHIRNVALIDELELSFAPGLNVMTGETGAGKSLLMQAIGLALGSRASGDLIRRGSTELVVEAVFGVDADRVASVLDAHGLPADAELIVRRVIADTGRGRVYLNGALTTLAVLREVSRGLMQIYGQHEQHVLREGDSGLRLLDDFAAAGPQVQEMARRYAALRTARDRLDDRRRRAAAAAERQDLVRFQLDEIHRAALQPDEEDGLRRERAILVNAEKLYETAAGGEDSLVAGDDAVTDRIGRLAAKLRELVHVDDSLGEVVGLLDGGLAQVEEAGLALRRYAERLSPDPGRLDEIDTRLALISNLKKKYGGSVEAVLARQRELEREVQDIEGGDEALTALRIEVEQAEEAAWVWAAELSATRREAGPQLEAQVQAELAQLGMQGARFAAHFAEQAAEESAEGVDSMLTRDGKRLGEHGCDQVEFRLSANPGEPLQPLAQVASGGELSRLMLALKALSAAQDATPTLIFDEVDAGIGGGVAEVVGRRLKTLAARHQVLCITHLPQIAAFADHAYTVTKKLTGGRTISSAKRLTQRERLQELARMLGGVEITTEARRHAREMLDGARRG